MIILVLSFSKKNNDQIDVNSDTVLIDEPLYISQTSNLVSKGGHFISLAVETTFEYVFIVINKIIGFVLGI